MTNPETDIQREIMRVLDTVPGVQIYRNTVGVIGRRRIRVGLCVGSSDLIGWRTLKNGVAQFLAIEVKVPGEGPSDAQREFIAEVNRAGGLAFIATSAEEAVKEVMK